MSFNDSSVERNTSTEAKRHAACDECRKRKLKCSGEKAGCRRCVRQGLTCHFSIQKQMGRPPKKRVRENDDIDANIVGNSFPLLSDFEKDWTSAEVGVDTFHLCPPVYLNRPTDPGEPSVATSLEPMHRLRPVFETSDPWPDFSTASAASAMLSMNSGIPGIPSLPSEPISPGLVQDKPQCPCLSYLYLCLSTLSSLNAFSVTKETIDSLHTTARTAQSVIRCEICPLEFATGMQNVMMLGTLLSVVSDAWLRVSEADAEALGKDIASVAFQNSVTDDPQGAKATWRQWLRQIIRWSVIGGHIEEDLCRPSVMCSCTPSILSLILELEARQRKWHADKRSHNLTPHSDTAYSHLSSPQSLACSVSTAVSTPSIDPAEEKRHMEESDMLCLKIVGTARAVLERFGFQPWEYPEGVEPL